MNSVNNAVNHISKGFQNSLEIAAFTVGNSEALEKVAKITERTIRAVEVIFGGLSNAVSNFGSQLKDAIIVFESLRFVGIMNFLITPKNGKYFLTDPANSWQKRLDRVTLAFHCAFKTVKGLNKFGFVELGVMAKNAIGQLPIFVLAMDSFIVASSFFSSWDSLANSLPKASKNLSKDNYKLDKWEYRLTAIALLKAGDEIERKYFEVKYNDKSSELHAELDGLEKKARLNDDKLQKALAVQQEVETQIPNETVEKIVANCKAETKKLSLEIGRVQVKLEKVDERLAKIAARDCRGLAEDLEKANIHFKIKKWEVCKANDKQEKSKVWIKIANAVGKIAVVALALTLTAINLWTAPFMLSLIFMGILVDSIGLSKILVEEFWKAKPIPKKSAIAA